MRYGQATDIGKIRETNEDGVFSAIVSAQFHQTSMTYGIFIVADGMGGARFGERVTALILPVISHHILKELPSSSFETDNQEVISRIVAEAVRAGNLAILHDPELSQAGGGAAVTAGVLVGNSVILDHVGNTRAYYINSDGFQQITRDHTLPGRGLVDYYPFSANFAEIEDDFPIRVVLYRALGQTEDMDVDTFIQTLSEGDFLLLCSDGLNRHVKDVEIQQCVLNAPTPQEACDRLIALANERGGEDNISVIVVQI